MKRFHVHVAVENLEASIRFYCELFAAEPVVRKPDYAKWMLEDPRVNFAISQRGEQTGIRHLGIQVEDRVELGEVYDRLKRADRPVLEEGATTCCYAQSVKSWIEDPQGVKWETFLTTGDSTVYGTDEPSGMQRACCEPAIAQAPGQETCRAPGVTTAAGPTRCCG
jgi:catechol 2,3-dioxygenase-like lactoylglutathione lyase family enzyme